MRSSELSSDVCSSDLASHAAGGPDYRGFTHRLYPNARQNRESPPFRARLSGFHPPFRDSDATRSHGIDLRGFTHRGVGGSLTRLSGAPPPNHGDPKRGGAGTSVTVRGNLGGRRLTHKKNKQYKTR